MRHLCLFAALFATAAHASQCAPPLAFVLPKKTVAEGGLLYLFLPVSGGFHEREHFEEEQRRILGKLWVEASDGKALPYELKRVAHGDVYDVFTLRVNARVGSEFVVKPLHVHSAVTVVKRETSKPLALEIRRGDEDNFRDTLSRESSRVLIPSLDAPAFRVSWSGGSVVLPGRTFRAPRHEPPLRLDLGGVYCTAETAQWKTPTEFTVTALMSDGREVTAAPIRLEPPPSYDELPLRKFP